MGRGRTNKLCCASTLCQLACWKIPFLVLTIVSLPILSQLQNKIVFPPALNEDGTLRTNSTELQQDLNFRLWNERPFIGLEFVNSTEECAGGALGVHKEVVLDYTWPSLDGVCVTEDRPKDCAQPGKFGDHPFCRESHKFIDTFDFEANNRTCLDAGNKWEWETKVDVKINNFGTR